MPEYCSHNETRGPEKSVTQVSLWQPFYKPLRQGAALEAQRTEPAPSAAPRYAKHVPNLLSDA